MKREPTFVLGITFMIGNALAIDGRTAWAFLRVDYRSPTVLDDVRENVRKGVYRWICDVKACVIDEVDTLDIRLLETVLWIIRRHAKKLERLWIFGDLLQTPAVSIRADDGVNVELRFSNQEHGDPREDSRKTLGIEDTHALKVLIDFFFYIYIFFYVFIFSLSVGLGGGLL